ncbi:uncharacterized protein [Pseudorca crassidens]|uniref:uncharacterized protein n=1 Tax=Pseudorca crassidens TaxID=82174 RepID=UPI00352FB95F
MMMNSKHVFGGRCKPGTALGSSPSVEPEPVAALGPFRGPRGEARLGPRGPGGKARGVPASGERWRPARPEASAPPPARPGMWRRRRQRRRRRRRKKESERATPSRGARPPPPHAALAPVRAVRAPARLCASRPTPRVCVPPGPRGGGRGRSQRTPGTRSPGA